MENALKNVKKLKKKKNHKNVEKISIFFERNSKKLYFKRKQNLL